MKQDLTIEKDSLEEYIGLILHIKIFGDYSQKEHLMKQMIYNKIYFLQHFGYFIFIKKIR